MVPVVATAGLLLVIAAVLQFSSWAEGWLARAHDRSSTVRSTRRHPWPVSFPSPTAYPNPCRWRKGCRTSKKSVRVTERRRLAVT